MNHHSLSDQLLAALIDLVQQVESGFFDSRGADHPDSAVIAAKTIISKATGGSVMSRYRAGKPADIPLRPVEFAGDEPDEGMHMLAYLFVALVLTCAVIGIGFIAGRYFS